MSALKYPPVFCSSTLSAAAIPAKLSPIMAKKKDQTEIFKLMKAAIDETLEELADFDKICKEDKEKEG